MIHRNPVEAVRDRMARRNAVTRYAAAHDAFSEAEQLYTGAGLVDEAQLAHEYAVWLLRAYLNESQTVKQLGTPYYYDPHDRGTP